MKPDWTLDERRAEKSFIDQLEGMPPRHFAVVALIVKGYTEKQICEAIHAEPAELNGLLYEEGLCSWKLLRRIIEIADK